MTLIQKICLGQQTGTSAATTGWPEERKSFGGSSCSFNRLQMSWFPPGQELRFWSRTAPEQLVTFTGATEDRGCEQLFLLEGVERVHHSQAGENNS